MGTGRTGDQDIEKRFAVAAVVEGAARGIEELADLVYLAACLNEAFHNFVSEGGRVILFL